MERLLINNYDRLTEESGLECTALVVKYVAENSPSAVANESVYTIKNVTKVGHHVMDKYPELVNRIVVRLFDYCMVGANKAREKRLIAIAAHFLGYGADFANRIYKDTKDLNWLIRAHEKNKESANLTKNLDQKYSRIALEIESKRTIMLFEITGDIKWMIERYEADIQCAKMSDNKKYTYHKLSFAGDSANEVFNKTRNKMWAQQALSCYELAVDYFKKNPYPVIEKSVRIMETKIKQLKYLLKLPPTPSSSR